MVVGDRAALRRGLALLVGVATVLSAAAQEPGPTELEALFQKTVRAKNALTPAEGDAIHKQLQDWKLVPAQLTPSAREQVMQLELFVALARGDAALAGHWHQIVAGEFPATRYTLRAAWLVAGAAGNGQLGAQTLAELENKHMARPEGVTIRRVQLNAVGRPAPADELSAGDTRVVLREPGGIVRAVTLWSADKPLAANEAQEIAALHTAYAGNPIVQFVGLCGGGADKVAAAKEAAAQNGFGWPQFYAAESPAAAHAFAAFAVSEPPWLAVVDQHGNVRMVGAANDAAVAYALRAATAEALGQFSAVLPKNIAGEAAAPPQPATPAGQAGAAPEGEKAAALANAGELPSNDEARKLLDQARLYMKTGRKTDARKLLEDVVQKYPGTREAQDAKERLANL